MWDRIRDNARALRALAALGVAVALAFLLFSSEQAHVKSRSEAVHAVMSTLWSVSELFFESQRTVTVVESFRAGRADLADVQLRFDILWSRVDVVVDGSFHLSGVFDHHLDQYRALLIANDPLISGDGPMDRDAMERFVEDLSTLNVDTRRAWVKTFGTGDPLDSFKQRTDGTMRQERIKLVAFLLIATLLCYVLAEVFFANRGHRREAALRHEAAVANAAKTQFLANVSHEIRTPLNGILGMASELSETELTGDQAQCLRIIEQSGGVLLGTINDVLDLSRIEAGQLGVEERPFVLRDLVEAACALYSASAREKGLYLTLNVQDNLPPVLIGDDLRIRQVLHNLIANAVKFTATGGVQVRVRSDLEGGRLTIAVQDSGPGIDREAQKRIFEPFLQADAGVTRQHGGSGLGLTISRQLCHAMGGDLMVVSRRGHGATFFCDLPLRAAHAEVVKQVQSKPFEVPELGGVGVLVADDNATNRLLLKRFLEPTQAQLVFAENGSAALEAVKDAPFEIILMDVQMPVMDGVMATRKIRALEQAQSSTPAFIIGVTANVLSHQVTSYLEAGMDEVLSKPLSKRNLFAAIDQSKTRPLQAAGHKAIPGSKRLSAS